MAAALAGRLGPCANLLKLADGRSFVKEILRLGLGDAQSTLADVVCAPFDEQSAKRRHDRLQEWNVFLDELLLQTDGVRGHHDSTFLIRQCGLNGRHEISEALADASAGFNHEVSSPIDSLSD